MPNLESRRPRSIERRRLSPSFNSNSSYQTFSPFWSRASARGFTQPAAGVQIASGETVFRRMPNALSHLYNSGPVLQQRQAPCSGCVQPRHSAAVLPWYPKSSNPSLLE